MSSTEKKAISEALSTLSAEEKKTLKKALTKLHNGAGGMYKQFLADTKPLKGPLFDQMREGMKEQIVEYRKSFRSLIDNLK